VKEEDEEKFFNLKERNEKLRRKVERIIDQNIIITKTTPTTHPTS
jgi:hypothetical protein